MIFITRKEHFNAAHKLHRADWSEEKNNEVFGKCANPNWHGHNYTLFVTVKGNPNPETGFLVNLKELSTLIRDEICEKLEAEQRAFERLLHWEETKHDALSAYTFILNMQYFEQKFFADLA